MRENRPSGSEGGEALRFPDPYRIQGICNPFNSIEAGD
jgi:hypothetical protein